MTTHRCHALRCGEPCPPRMLMCKPCWSKVDYATQREVYRTVKLRGTAIDASWAPWWRAAHQAIAQAAKAHGVECEKWIARQMAFADELEGKS